MRGKRHRAVSRDQARQLLTADAAPAWRRPTNAAEIANHSRRLGVIMRWCSGSGVPRVRRSAVPKCWNGGALPLVRRGKAR
ncbi:hypothetical protein [Streptomyces sp. NPDC088847]|uniref:hypothetical protein n=1 Tax=Streptomyces sp. NPDC088847 TaxID=3365909 RepID=UPI0038098DF2